MMYSKHRLYKNFKKDLNLLMKQEGPDHLLDKLAQNTKQSSWNNHKEQKSIVEAIDRKFYYSQLWKDIKTAYKL